MKQALGLLIAALSIPVFAIAYSILILAGLAAATAEALKDAGEWIAK